MCKISDLVRECVEFQHRLRMNGAIISQMLAKQIEDGKFANLNDFTNTINGIPHLNGAVNDFISILNTLQEGTGDLSITMKDAGMVEETMHDTDFGGKCLKSYVKFDKLPLDEQERILLQKIPMKHVMAEYHISKATYYSWLSGNHNPALMASLIRSKQINFEGRKLNNVGAKFILEECSEMKPTEISMNWGWSIDQIEKLRNGESHKKVWESVTG